MQLTRQTSFMNLVIFVVSSVCLVQSVLAFVWTVIENCGSILLTDKVKKKNARKSQRL